MDTETPLPPKTIIFDLGRVLIHYEHQRTLAGLAAVSRLDATQIGRLNDKTVDEQMGRGEMNARQIHQYFVETAGTTEDFDAFVAGYAAGIQRDEKALAYAVSLTERPNLQIGIISNTNEAHAIWLHANLPELKRFRHVILSNEVGLIKPDARIYQMSMDALEAEPSNCLFVDDLQENIEGAEALGMAGLHHADWLISRPKLEAWFATP